MDFGETWWKRILQISRSFLNQHFRNQTAGKQQNRGKHVFFPEQIVNDYFHVNVGFPVFRPRLFYEHVNEEANTTSAPALRKTNSRATVGEKQLTLKTD